MVFRAWAAVPVYIALSYLVSKPNTRPEAFFMGLCVYAVRQPVLCCACFSSLYFTCVVVWIAYPLSHCVRALPFFTLLDLCCCGQLISLHSLYSLMLCCDKRSVSIHPLYSLS